MKNSIKGRKKRDTDAVVAGFPEWLYQSNNPSDYDDENVEMEDPLEKRFLGEFDCRKNFRHKHISKICLHTIKYYICLLKPPTVMDKRYDFIIIWHLNSLSF